MHSLLQEIFKYKKCRQDVGHVVRKTTAEFEKPEMVRVDSKIYFVASKVYLLSERDLVICGARELSGQEVSDLPVKFLYTGPPTNFSCDEEGFFQRFFDLITDFNSLQNPENYSFPLGKFWS